jgi:hypothetical protein
MKAPREDEGALDASETIPTHKLGKARAPSVENRSVRGGVA